MINVRVSDYPESLLAVFYCYYTFKVVSGTKNICPPTRREMGTPKVINGADKGEEYPGFFNIKADESCRKDVFVINACLRNALPTRGRRVKLHLFRS